MDDDTVKAGTMLLAMGSLISYTWLGLDFKTCILVMTLAVVIMLAFIGD